MKSKTFGWIGLIVRGENLNLNAIESIVHTPPSRFIPKNSGKPFKATKDTWIYKEEFCAIDEKQLSGKIEEAISSYLCKFENINIPELKSLSEETYVTIYLSSNYAQIGFTVNNDFMKRLYDLGLEVEFSILSMGEADEI